MARINRLRAARARSHQEFCVAYGGTLDADDPFTALLIHDGRADQPWSRIDVKRNIVSIADHAGDFVALSDEGDVYWLREGDVRREKIPGAGVHSEDATGRGAMQALGIIGGRLAACGFGGQVYGRDAGGAWSPMGAPTRPGKVSRGSCCGPSLRIAATWSCAAMPSRTISA